MSNDYELLADLIRGIMREEVKPITDRLDGIDSRLSSLDDAVRRVLDDVVDLTDRVDEHDRVIRQLKPA